MCIRDRCNGYRCDGTEQQGWTETRDQRACADKHRGERKHQHERRKRADPAHHGSTQLCRARERCLLALHLLRAHLCVNLLRASLAQLGLALGILLALRRAQQLSLIHI